MISGIVERLLADSNVTNLVGTEIYPVVSPQTTQLPYVTLRRTGVTPTIVKNEVSGKDEIIFTVIAYAKEYKQCIQILEAIRTSLDNFKGDLNGKTFLNIWYQVSEDLFDKEDDTYVVSDAYAARVKR